MEVATATPTGLDLLRVDIVGSFLRPPVLKHAATAFAAGAGNAAELRRLDAAAIAELIAQEERHAISSAAVKPPK